MNRIAIIPARGGSRRVPDKNIRTFAGRPIIHHVIETARASRLFRRIIVATDSERIAEVARQGGAEVPFLREAGNADDHAPLVDAILETLRELENQGDTPEFACCLLATAVMLSPGILSRSWDHMDAGGMDTVISLQKFRYPIQRALRRNADGLLTMMWPEHRQTRSQDLETAWHDAGQFYWFRREALLRQGRLFADRTGGYELGPFEAVDIDTPEDWSVAETLFSVCRTVAGHSR